MRKRWLIGMGIVAAGLLGLRPPGASLAENPKTPGAEKAAEARKLPAEVEALNAASRKLYADARTVELSTIPVIFLSGDELVLRRNGKRTVATVVPAEYHTLKSIAHTTLGLFAHLAVEPGQPLSAERLKTLKEYQALLTAAGPAVEKFGFDDNTLARQKRILARAQKLIDTVLMEGKVSGDELTKFCRVSREDVLANGRGAVRAQLLAMHKQVMEWKKHMPAEEWAALTVIVPGAATARTDNAVVQYFARLFGETNGEGRRLVYSESLYDEENALKLLGTLRLDAKLASTMFGDRFRLHRDFLADGGRTAIDEILAPP